MIQIQVRLFGAFRKVGDGSSLNLELAGPVQVSEFRTQFSEALKRLHPEFDAGLVSESAFATEDTVLDETALIERDSRLAILPPVCGG